MMRLSFEVIGHPEPAGSKRAFLNRKTGKTQVADANPRTLGWKTEVALAADAAMMKLAWGNRAGCVIGVQTLEAPGRPELFTGPVGLAVVFWLTRPKGHFGTGRNAGRLKDSAPEWPAVKPDCTKLLRGVEDALTGVVWRDDAQVVEQSVTKRYGDPERVQVIVWML